jgi:hypothetical protein
MKKITLVNNTSINLTRLHADYYRSICTGVCPEDLQEIFQIYTIEIDGYTRVIVNWA